MDMEELVKQAENKPLRNEKGQLMPGHTANPNGRPPGKTLKEYQAEKFRQMPDEEKEVYLTDIPKGERWRMAEGNPAQDNSHEIKGELIVHLAPEIVKKNAINTSSE